jgi:hypothetical protein
MRITDAAPKATNRNIGINAGIHCGSRKLLPCQTANLWHARRSPNHDNLIDIL